MALSNQQFADRVGCDFTTASRLRNGQRRPSVALMTRISEEFGLPLDELVDAHNQGPKAFGKLLTLKVFNDYIDPTTPNVSTQRRSAPEE